MDEIERGQHFRATLRTFEVVLYDKSVVHVFAHYHDNETPAGHLNFFVVQPSGRRLINDSYAVGTWLRVREITPEDDAKRIDRIASRANARERGKQALENMRRPDRYVH